MKKSKARVLPDGHLVGVEKKRSQWLFEALAHEVSRQFGVKIAGVWLTISANEREDLIMLMSHKRPTFARIDHELGTIEEFK